jgi:hypothetical protein
METRSFLMSNVVSLPTRALQLSLIVSDPDVLTELEKLDELAEREAYALSALRLGVLAMRQAKGSLDTDSMRREGEHMVQHMTSELIRRNGEVSLALTKYLEPASGLLPQRIEQLTKPNGDLELMLAKHLHGDQSVIAQTLSKHLGEQSPIFKMLSPKQSDGLMASMSDMLKRALQAQREELFKQFSLDHEGSALQRLAAMLAETSEAVDNNLTLDDEASPLARLKREILDVLSQQQKANTEFQAQVRSTLETQKVKREEQARSPVHGQTFETQAGQLLARIIERSGDLFENVAKSAGRTQRMVGDFAAELGDDSACPGARIVVEAKANKSYTIKKAIAELEVARGNRDAQVGIMVFDRASAPDGLSSLRRVGNDILVIWDAEDAASDLMLSTAYDLARALAHRAHAASSEAEADFSAIDGLIKAIASHLEALSAIEKTANTIKKNGESILTNATKLREKLEQQLDELREHMLAVRGDAAE